MYGYLGLRWPVYEIENFLLEPQLLRRTLAALLRRDPLGTDDATVAELRSVARRLVDRLALVEVQRALNDEFRRCLDIGGAPGAATEDLAASAEASKVRASSIDASTGRIASLLAASKATLDGAIDAETFLEDFPGERLLHGLAGEYGLAGEVLKNACLDQAQQMKLRPEGLERVLLELLAMP